MPLALKGQRIEVIELTPEIVVDAANLPGSFHPDPADRLIVATARAHGATLLTTDAKILAYPHVQTL
jgi:PIN domain nuclease of toxin-antitoxin system